MKRFILILAISIVSIFALNAWELREAKQKLYNAYIHGDNTLWLDVMDNLQASYTKSKNIFTLYELAKSQYGYMGFLIDRSEFDKAREILPKTEISITKLLKYNPDWVDVHGLKAGVYGFKIILFPTQVIFNGPKGKDCLEKASSFNELTPAILVEMANYKYHTPSILGGDIDQAIMYYQYAIKLFELTNQKDNNWQYINTMVWLAISYDKKGESDKAKKILNKLLQEEPEFTWVKNDLYPKILKNESISKTYFSFKN